MKTLAYVKLYTPCAVFLYSVGPSVSSNVLLETKCKCLKSHFWLREILSARFHSPLVALFFEKMCVFLIGLGLCFFNKCVRILVKGVCKKGHS